MDDTVGSIGFYRVRDEAGVLSEHTDGQAAENARRYWTKAHETCYVTLSRTGFKMDPELARPPFGFSPEWLPATQ